MSTAAEHIASWEAAGLLDPVTAERLRTAESETEAPIASDRAGDAVSLSAASRIFGPGVTVAEVFGYLGGGFLIAAWGSIMGTIASSSGDPELVLAVLGSIAAGVLTALALMLRRRDERFSRAAGALLLVALGFVSAAVLSLLSGSAIESPESGVFASSVVLFVAVIYRRLHPAVLTQIGLLGSLTALAGASLVWLQDTVFPEEVSPVTGDITMSGPDPIILVVASAAWWLLVAVVIGLIGLAEARRAGRADDPTAASRAAVTRFWAGLLAVIGLSTSASRSAMLADGQYGRVLEPVIGDVALLILSAILVERAFRRDATSYIYAAALGLIVALTDFNISYLSDTTGAALLVEGLILIGVGIGADRLRRRVGRDGATPPAEPAAVEPPPPAEPALEAP